MFTIMIENYFKITDESQNVINYFKAVNATFLSDNVKALFIVKAFEKVYLKLVFTKEEYLNKFTFVTTFTNLDLVVDTCDSDENPEGKLFLEKLPNDLLIDLFVNLDEEYMVQIFDDELISIPFISEHYQMEVF